MQGSTGDREPNLGSRVPKMRQNHPETSLIPSHITPKYIPKLFWGEMFHPKSLKNGQGVLGTYRPYKTAKPPTGPSCATPKPVCGGPCGQPSAWMPPTVSQDTTQSLWDPTLGSPGHPGSGKIQLVRFSLFSSQICLTKLPKPPRGHPVRPRNLSAGVPAGDQVLGCLLQCLKTPHNQYGALPWGPPGTLGPTDSKIF